MREPILVVMAAGMGSRYGGLKQIDPVGSAGELIIDFSIYDAIKAGFKKVIFIIKEEIEESFRENIGDRISKHIEVEYAYQRLDDLPKGYSVPPNRVKPWGTGHAVLAVRDIVNQPFVVINADDYYGSDAFSLIYRYLLEGNNQAEYAMVGYKIENTLSDHGHVARGICQMNSEQYLETITERTHIEWRNGHIQYVEDDDHWRTIPEGTTVSMNFWGFYPGFLRELESRFPAFLDKALASDTLKSEYFLPAVVDELIIEEKVKVKVLKSSAKWYGVTYKKDKPIIVEAIANMKKQGIYPEVLWEE